MRRLRQFTLYLPPEYIEMMDAMVRAKLYPHRNEIIRIALRDLFRKEGWLVAKRLREQKATPQTRA